MKTTRGPIRGLRFAPLVFLSMAVTCVVGQEIPGVGLGDLEPICDPLVSECISGDEQVQDALIAELEEDDQITGESLSGTASERQTCCASSSYS